MTQPIKVFNEEALRSPGQGLLPRDRNRQEHIVTAPLDLNNISESMYEILSTSISNSVSSSLTRAESLKAKTIAGVFIRSSDPAHPSMMRLASEIY